MIIAKYIKGRGKISAKYISSRIKNIVVRYLKNVIVG